MKRNKTAAAGILISVVAMGLYSFAEQIDPEDIPDMQEASGQVSAGGLTKQGQKLEAKYQGMLDELKKEVLAALPELDAKKVDEFLGFHKTVSGLAAPGKDAAPDAFKKYKEERSRAESNALVSARSILPQIDGFLASDKLDDKLMQIAVITDATPKGLAEFAQQGQEEEGLIDKLFADRALMKQMLVAGGANGGEWGESMQVYEAILAKSERAREPDTIFQRMALGTALHQPLLKGKESGGVYGIMLGDSSNPDGPVSRYLHYEKAYLDGELDEAFKDFNTWECRFIGNDPYTNEELAWTREMMRNYRPDHITNTNHAWRYTMIVKTDVPYKSPEWREGEGTTRVQQIVAGGGKCGPRAFYGRTATRAFGIPARRSTQTGHAAMNRWTPNGWVVRFGAWWAWNWDGPWGGEDFFLESQAREFPEEFMKVLRAQWVGDALGEQDVSIRYYGKGGGLWNALAFYTKRAVVEDAKEAALQTELAKLTADEAKVLLGETDAPTDDEVVPGIVIRDVDRKVSVSEDGTITVPAAACITPTNNTERILFMTNLVGEAQVHYSRLGKQPDLLKYYIEVPSAGKYALTAHVVNVARDQSSLLRLNRRTLIDLPLPTSWGMWQDTKPVEIDLTEGRNTLMFTCEPPNRGVSIKYFTLKPLSGK